MIDQLLADASRIAEDYQYDRVEAEHLLFVLLSQESGREQMDALGLNLDEILSNLLSGFRHHKRRASLKPVRLIISDEVMQTLETASNARDISVGSVLNLLRMPPIQEPSSINTLFKSTKASRTATDLLLREPLPDLDELLDGLEQDEMFSGFETISNEAIDAPRDRDKRVGPTGLMDHGRNPDEKRRSIPPEDMPETRERSQPAKSSLSEKERSEALRAVERSLRNLTELHFAGGLDPIIGRDKEINQVCEVLMRRRKSNVLLVGEPGVGKTALMEGVAARVALSTDPALSTRPVLQASLGALVAGARYRGDFEIRMELLIELSAERNAILFFDEMQMLIGAGATAERGMDGANLLKPALARDGLSLIGATTYEELSLIKGDAALMRRFELIRIREPKTDLMREILRGAASPYLTYHHMKADPRMLDRVVEFADSYLQDRRFPDKAFDVLDTACVRARLDGRKSLQVGDIRDAIKRLGGTLPVIGSGTTQDQNNLRDHLLSCLPRKVAGHPNAIRELADLVAFRRPGEPLNIILDGPIGIGRRTLARALAAELGLGVLEVSTNSGLDTLQDEISSSLDKDPARLIILNINNSFDDELSILKTVRHERYSESSSAKISALKDSIIILRKNVSSSSLGFSHGKIDKNVEMSDLRFVQMPGFDAERIRYAVRFEMDRLSKICSDSGVSRPIPSECDVLPSSHPRPLLWRDVEHLCSKAISDLSEKN